MGKAALMSHMEGARHQRRVRDSAKSVSIARSFASVEETSQVAPTTFTNDSVMEGTGEGRAVQSLSDLCMLSKKVADAEILWALKCVSSHFSGSSNTGVNDLFKRMFSDSQIAANYSNYALLFDESLNEEMQSKQLDVHVRYWSSENGRVESRYLTSMFIGHGRTDDILKHFEEAMKDLDPAKTWNIGMDGPNVNLAFERELRKIS